MKENMDAGSQSPVFILIDDELVSNFICRKVITKAYSDAEVQEFTSANNALEFIRSAFEEPKKNPAIVLLDINMPFVSGWDFLEAFAGLDNGIKNNLRIFMLSSSLDPADKKRAVANPYVVDYIEKPLTPEIVLNVIL
jgi:two-component system chemotaxis response regulator CheY